MKRIVLGVLLSLVGILCLGVEAIAAPTAVSLKACTGVDPLALEVTVPFSDNVAAVIVGSTTYPLGTTGWGFEYLTVGAGLRYYFLPEGWRPFTSLYGTYSFSLDPTVTDSNYVNIVGTAGLEYQEGHGFRWAVEVGGVYYIYPDQPTLIGWEYVGTISFGYAF